MKLNKNSMYYSIFLYIALVFLNLSFLDRLIFSKRSNWVPFYENPNKWFDICMADKEEIPPPTYYQGHHSSIEYTGTIDETPEETARKKEFFRRKIAEEKFYDVGYIQNLEAERDSKKKTDDEWLEKIQVHGIITIAANLIFIGHHLFS